MSSPPPQPNPQTTTTTTTKDELDRPTVDELDRRALLLDIRERDIELKRRQNDVEIAEARFQIAQKLAEVKKVQGFTEDLKQLLRIMDPQEDQLHQQLNNNDLVQIESNPLVQLHDPSLSNPKPAI